MNQACGKNMDQKLNDLEQEGFKLFKAMFDEFPPEAKEKIRGNCKKPCESYMESDSYNNGETDTAGYYGCCNTLGFCGGMSGWVIFLIILIVIGCLAAAGTAFYFFYWKRKMGGRDEEEKEVESGEDTTKSGYDISVDTY
ncbi:hypothetical protein B9Z55_007133 [Caenorhabditis nigoni]|uniref:Uncharacterized protein n=1 Tax=Caenorhabditis nigoni TaxID=1611254 RepID=A0A2G5V8B1_9PELO|nr:hypothetical protein B9Z55_007133 [Caenorhabditis nigoni]